MDLITLFLKTINKKGAPKPAKTKPKDRARKKSQGASEEDAEGDAEADAEAGQAAVGSKAAKALFEAMKAKMRGTGAERKQLAALLGDSEHSILTMH